MDVIVRDGLFYRSRLFWRCAAPRPVVRSRSFSHSVNLAASDLPASDLRDIFLSHIVLSSRKRILTWKQCYPLRKGSRSFAHICPHTLNFVLDS